VAVKKSNTTGKWHMATKSIPGGNEGIWSGLSAIKSPNRRCYRLSFFERSTIIYCFPAEMSWTRFTGAVDYVPLT